MSKNIIIASIGLAVVLATGFGIYYAFKVPIPEKKFDYILYATKQGKQVKVVKGKIENKEETVILEYEEPIEAKSSGNLWEGLMPSIDLSSDSNLLVYADKTGLHIFNLSKNEKRTIIKKIKEGSGYRL